MDLDKCFHERKSVRHFSEKQIPFEKIAEILDAARFAPSSGNAQNWRFIIVRNNKEAIAETAEGSEWMSTASVLIVVCSDQERMKLLYGVRGEALYGIQNCAAAIEHMLLKAISLGIASCWVGKFDEKKVGEILALPPFIRPQAILAFGYGEEHEIQHREPLRNFVHFEKWGEQSKNQEYLPLKK